MTVIYTTMSLPSTVTAQDTSHRGNTLQKVAKKKLNGRDWPVSNVRILKWANGVGAHACDSDKCLTQTE